MKKIYLSFTLLVMFCNAVLSQNVGVNTTGAAPDASAMLDVSSANKGLLVPRVALTATNVATPVTTPATSLLVYNTATAGTAPNNVVPGYYYWTGTAWTPFMVSSGPNSGWLLSGNVGTTPATQFLGTTDDKQVVFRSNNTSYLELGSRTNLGLVQAYPDYNNGAEKVTYVRSALQFEAAAASFYKPKMFADANGNFRIKGSSAGTDYFELGATGTANSGGFEFIIGDDGDEPIAFRSYNVGTGTTSEMMRLQSGRMAIGTTTFDAASPEKLLIDAGNTTSYNLVNARGSMDSYLQLNVRNNSSGPNASSDVVATANNGSESNFFVDLGINGSGYSGGVMGSSNDAYLYNLGQNLLIGAGTSGKSLIFLTGGTTQATHERMRIDGTGAVTMGGTLGVTGAVSMANSLGVTGTVGIGFVSPAVPNATTKLDVNGAVKLGAVGTVVKNIVAADISSALVNIPAAALNTLAATFTPGVADVTVTVPTLSSTRGTARVSLNADLAAGVSIAWARVISTTQVRIRFLNSSTTAQSITAGTRIYVSVTEF